MSEIRDQSGEGRTRDERGGEKDGAEKAGCGDEDIPAGGAEEELNAGTAASGEIGARHPGEGDFGEDGRGPVGDVWAGRERAKEDNYTSVAGPDGGGDGLQRGVWRGASEGQDSGHGGG